MDLLRCLHPPFRAELRLPGPWPACAQGLLRGGAHWLRAGQAPGWGSDILALPGGPWLTARWRGGAWQVFRDGAATSKPPYAALEAFAAESPGPLTGALGFELACAEAGLPCRMSTEDALGMAWRAAPAWLVVGPEGAELWSWEASADPRPVEQALSAACALARPALGPLTPRWSEARHRAAVEAIRAGIHDGAFYVANLCVPFDARLEGDAITFALAALRRNRPPFGAWLDLGELRLLSLSMERLLCREGARLRSEPIKGTVPRTGDVLLDEEAARHLAADPKERAEHTMILDLVRNDLGRVARVGSVRVAEALQVRPFGTVQHLVSAVEAEVAPETGLAEVLRAVLPGGSVTGAPKHAVCGHLAQAEDAPRGFYCGALGWIAPGALAYELAMPIRTAQLRDAALEYWTGGGITRLSDPAAEWAELWLKAKALG